MRFAILIMLSVGILSSCNKDDKIVFFEEDEAVRLLTLDSNKTWTRTLIATNGVPDEATTCEINQLLTFYKSTDSLYFEQKSDPSICQNESFFTQGRWDVVEDPAIRGRIKYIMFVSNADTLYKNIDEITSLYLGTSYTLNDEVIQERFQKSD